MDIQEKNVIAAYNTADDSTKSLLRTLFPDIDFEANTEADNRPVTERIKTFEDACNELGCGHPFVLQYKSIAENEDEYGVFGSGKDIIAYLKLRVVCAALNEGWEPDFSEDEWRWYPWHYLYTQEELNKMSEEDRQDRAIIDTGDFKGNHWAGFVSAYSRNAPSSTSTAVGSRLCLKNRELSTYCGKQFIDLWADFKLIRSAECDY